MGLKCPESIEELEELDKLIPLCRKDLYAQAKAKIESGAACSLSEASRQLGEDLDRDPESIRSSIQRERKTEGVAVLHLETQKYAPKTEYQKEIIKEHEQEKKEEKEAQKKIQREQTPEPLKGLPKDKFRTIVIDPPWPVKKILRDVRPNQDRFDYPPLSLDQIKEIEIQNIAHENCHIYLWTTHKFLPDALKVLEAWGFRYQCLLTWVKNVGMTPFSFMYSTEHCLFGRRGSLDLLKKGVRLDFSAKVREHSRKPDEFYEIVKTVSPGPRIDFFSREEREGFEQYGNETEKF